MNFTYERNLGAPDTCIAGIDEVGRGPLAGPVVAAAAVLDPKNIPPILRESKQHTPAMRQRLYHQLAPYARLGLATVAEIDKNGILHATFLAMARALARLPRTPAIALVDGPLTPTTFPENIRIIPIVRGDSSIASIAAASIVAKVCRDRLMAFLHTRHPAYGWHTNRGYGTATHMAALQKYGPSPYHRTSFAPVRTAALKNH